MPDPKRRVEKLLHDLSNDLSVIVGFVELVLETTPEDDPRRADLIEVRTAAKDGVRLVHEISNAFTAAQ